MKARIVWLILCCIWGSTWLFIKLGLADLPPITFAGIRFVIAFLILASLVIARRARWPRTRAEWILIAVSGALQFGLNYGLVFWGEQHISSGLAAVLQSTFPAFGLVIAHFYLAHERLTMVKVVGVLLGVLGVAVFYGLMRHMDVTHTMLIALVTPVVAVVLGMIVLHEKLNWRLLAGGACIIAGLALIVLRKRKSLSASEEEPELVPKP